MNSIRFFSRSYCLTTLMMMVVSGCGEPPKGSYGIPTPPDASSSTGDQVSSGVGVDLPLPSDPILQELGPLKVRLGDFQQKAEVQPWSGSWLPARNPWLTEGIRSPLHVWDEYIQRNFRLDLPSAWSFEKKLNVDSHLALTWEGSCDAWAIASLYESEPRTPLIDPRGQVISVGIQKSILVKSWEVVEGKRIYGRPYRADRSSDWNDLSPMALHRFIQSELFEQGRPFIIDKDPGIPVWNTPIFGVAFRLTADELDQSVIQVHAWLQGADPLFGNPDEVGTHVTWIELRYLLRVKPLPDGSFWVQSSEWVRDLDRGVDSIEFHPDFMVGLPPRDIPVQHRSHNPAIQEEVVEFLRSKAGLEKRRP